MEFFADILLVAAASGAGIYCFVLSRRLTRLNDLESGFGSAVAVLSAQVDDLTRALAVSQISTSEASATLNLLTKRAEGVAQRLEIMVAAFHDLPDTMNKPNTGPVAVTEPLNATQADVMFIRHRRADTGGM
jgi:hypothetical protein